MKHLILILAIIGVIFIIYILNKLYARFLESRIGRLKYKFKQTKLYKILENIVFIFQVIIILLAFIFLICGIGFIIFITYMYIYNIIFLK